MEKKDILEKSKQEFHNQDAFEKQVLEKGGALAMQLGGLFCLILEIISITVGGKPTFSYWSIYFGMLFVLFVYKFSKLHRRHELLVAITYGILTVCLLVCFALFEVTT